MRKTGKRCWACGSLSVIRWGARDNRQRFQCKNCGIFFTRNRPEQRIKNRFVWFKKWVLKRQALRLLSRDSGLSIDTLKRTSYAILPQASAVRITKRQRVSLRIDGTYFRQFCLICYQDDMDGYTQLFRFSNRENYGEIREDISNPLTFGVQQGSITTDEDKSILKVIKDAAPDVIAQRCLVHIQRMCLKWLTRYPRHPAVQELRGLVLQILKIKTTNDRIYWTKEFANWGNRRKDYLNKKTFNQDTGRYWYTRKLLRRSYLTIKRALPNMFHYIANPSIPNSNNGIEGFFSHLMNRLDLHRGLTLKNRVNFIKWYVYLTNEK